MGKRELRQMLTAVRRAGGHRSAGPIGVLDQSSERIRAPISPPPARKPGASLIRPSWSRRAGGPRRARRPPPPPAGRPAPPPPAGAPPPGGGRPAPGNGWGGG